MDIFQWLTNTELGKCIFTMLVSMIPIIELRGGLPFGVALGLPYHLAFPFAVLDKMEKKAHLKGQKVQKYQYLGLWLFVAIPLPGTGAWTGSLAAAFLDMRLKKALPAVILGVLTAGCIMLTLTHVGINLFSGTV